MIEVNNTDRTRTTAIHDELQTIITENLKAQFEYQKRDNKKITKQKILSEETGIGTTSISRWMKGQAIPSVEQLVLVSRAFNISINSLIEKDGHLSDTKIYTYKDALIRVLGLENLMIPQFQDPFLEYLYSRYYHIMGLGKVSPIKRESILVDLLNNYDRPILPLYLTQYSELFEYEYQQYDEDQTKLTVFNLFQDYMRGEGTDKVDALITDWLKDSLNDGHKYAGLNVPYGSSILFKKGPNGESILMTDEDKDFYKAGDCWVYPENEQPLY